MKRKDALWVMQMCRGRDARSEAEREAFDTAIEALKSESIFTADRPRDEFDGMIFSTDKYMAFIDKKEIHILRKGACKVTMERMFNTEKGGEDE